jgi:DNA polymerase III subunit gamma/tau
VSMHGRTLLEMAIVRICQLGELDDIATLIDELRGGNDKQPATRAAAPAATAKKNVEADLGRVLASAATSSQHSAAAEHTPYKLSVNASESDGERQPLTDLSAVALWQRALVDLGDTVAGSASHADRIATAGDNLIVASFPASCTFYKDICDRPENRSRLERILSEAAGQPIRLTFDVHDDGQSAVTPARPQRSSRREQLAEVAEQPFVRRAMEIFDVPAGQFRYIAPEGDS